ncbi:hypothetical protein [Polycladomyces subterraneus]|uniref:Uncharacterized protein n=1 Tax=Polycladomyces subterraneus TaxID=1016997 RepID=A0ABT8IK20_9BACL|nr:hypothetical protein [Polycladomyces subterraneus]MDN4593136.1 hypothetical protein [Polycladomyces subterraneus]
MRFCKLIVVLAFLVVVSGGYQFDEKVYQVSAAPLDGIPSHG